MLLDFERRSSDDCFRNRVGDRGVVREERMLMVVLFFWYQIHYIPVGLAAVVRVHVC